MATTTRSALDLTADVADLLTAIVDVESVSGDEAELTDLVQTALEAYDHLEVIRHDNCVIARTSLGRDSRVVIAGHLDTVPIAGNVPSRREPVDGVDAIVGRGSCDMKGGVAVQLSCAAELREPSRDVTWIFYDNEEVDAELNGLRLLAEARPELLDGDFAILCEPSDAAVEAGCQGTVRVRLTTTGVAAHSARGWKGHNAIHDLAAPLAALAAYEPRRVLVDGLEYREGLNAVRVGGGIAGNVIPDRAWMEINYRFAPSRSLDEAVEHLREVFAGSELEVVDGAGGALPGLDLPAAQDFVTAVGGGVKPKFGWTDVARFSAMGVPAVNFGPGDPGKAHADDEFCPVAHLHTCRDALLRWLG